MLSNKAFELTTEQLQRYDDWISKLASRVRADGESWSVIGEVEIVFTLSSIGRGVIARIPGSTEQVVIDDLFL